jgi:hypothetical protein
MSHLDDSSLDAGSTAAPPDSPEARSRRLHEEFEAYYAERKRRRLTAEALPAGWPRGARTAGCVSRGTAEAGAVSAARAAAPQHAAQDTTGATVLGDPTRSGAAVASSRR